MISSRWFVTPVWWAKSRIKRATVNLSTADFHIDHHDGKPLLIRSRWVVDIDVYLVGASIEGRTARWWQMNCFLNINPHHLRSSFRSISSLFICQEWNQLIGIDQGFLSLSCSRFVKNNTKLSLTKNNIDDRKCPYGSSWSRKGMKSRKTKKKKKKGTCINILFEVL